MNLPDSLNRNLEQLPFDSALYCSIEHDECCRCETCLSRLREAQLSSHLNQPHGPLCPCLLCREYRFSYTDADGNLTMGPDIPHQPLTMSERGLGCARGSIIALACLACFALGILLTVLLWKYWL